MLNRSIIVAAHPDDEVLWFSSILDKVNEIIVCFLGAKRYPVWTVGRQKSLEEYPIKNIASLNVDSADVFNTADWKNPVATDYGMEIVREDFPNQYVYYKNNYSVLKERLAKQLDGYRNVFTHNPWGEYGHEEHVQVYRVIKELQGKLGFNLWYSNYVGIKSLKFMESQRDRLCFEYVTCKTNRGLGHEIKEIYKRNKCWTWNDNWEWSKRESFIKEDEMKGHRRPCPTNFIRYGPPPTYYSRIKQLGKRGAKKILRTCGVQITRQQVDERERTASLQPDHAPHGTVLLSWHIAPFLLKPGEQLSTSHTVYWDCTQIARTFLELGYAVDVIDSHNQTFQPTKPYAFFVGHRINFDRIAGLLHRNCIKIAFLDTAHWVFNNQATYRRKLELQQRKSVTIKESHRLVELNFAIEHADYGIAYGNQFTRGTYRYAKTPFFCMPMSTCTMFPWSDSKDYGACRTNFLWFGSHGFVHKGLDLVLEAFADMPECQLYVCGPLEKEKDFVKAFYRELYDTPNIHAVGWVDVEGPEIREIVGKCVAMVFPSCSEGQAGTVTTAMHAGLIPIVSYESGVDVEDFGVVFKDHSIQTIQDAVRMVSHLPSASLNQMARKAWERARATYTRERFAEEFKEIIAKISEKGKR